MRERAKEIRALLAEERSRREALISAHRTKFGSDRAQAEDAFDSGKGISGRCPICNGDGVVSGRIREVNGSASCRVQCQICGGFGFALKSGYDHILEAVAFALEGRGLVVPLETLEAERVKAEEQIGGLKK